ncbi:MAG: choice-of-anchor C family protein [Ottowia sp.]|uniref:choice-of-anchor C family protein n=1 Tax=Ottowia sp. TaxID=1898956 RepID=UPI0039E352AC
MKTRTLGLFMAGALLAGAAQAAPFQNGSFEDGTDPGSFINVPNSTTAITGWTVSSIDYIGTYWNAQDGVRSVDLNGTAPGSVSQTFDTVAGRTYRVSFYLASNTDQSGAKTVDVLATPGGTTGSFTFPNTSPSTPSSMGWTQYSYTFTATSASTTLSFASTVTGTPANGAALDNVSVTDVTPAPVPTLSQWMLFGLAGLLGVAALRRRGLSR